MPIETLPHLKFKPRLMPGLSHTASYLVVTFFHCMDLTLSFSLSLQPFPALSHCELFAAGVTATSSHPLASRLGTRRLTQSNTWQAVVLVPYFIRSS